MGDCETGSPTYHLVSRMAQYPVTMLLTVLLDLVEPPVAILHHQLQRIFFQLELIIPIDQILGLAKG